MKAIELIAAERKRQIEEEGFTPQYDDRHRDEELARAGAYYALPEVLRHFANDYKDGFYWPWDEELFKSMPGDRIRDLVKAGALIAAEIDRLQRLEGI